MLEKLLKFLKENGIEVPEGADANSVIEIVKALINAEGADDKTEDKPEDKKPEDKTEDKPEDKKPEETPQGVA